MKILANLTGRQRITIAVAVVAVAAGLYALVQMRHEADFRPLFTGLSPEDAAGIVQKLKETGIEYRLPEGGGSVLAPSAKLAEMRIALAAAGLPRTGRMGFELFDKTNLGATEFTEHINYRRALEGELERSVGALAEVEQARVHLTFPKDSVFLDSQQPAKASVLVKVRAGARLSAQNVQAINHLVASAVEGLSPGAVSVLDMNGNLLGRPKAAGGLEGPEASEATLEYRHHIEADLIAKISSTLEALLGADRFRVGVSVECDFSGGEQSEEVFDPTRSVMVSSQRTEDNVGAASASGVPGTASSLPNPASRPGGSANPAARMTENVAYQSSRTVRKTRMPSGTVRRLSLAVLLDQAVTWEKDGAGLRKALAPPTPEKIKAIRDLVVGISGLDEKRGDLIVIESMPFETTLQLEPPGSSTSAGPGPAKTAPPAGKLLQLDRKTMIIAGAAAGGLLLLIIGAMIVLRKRRKAAPPSAPAALTAGEPAAKPAVRAGANVEQELESRLAEREALQQKLDAQALNSLKLAPVITKTAEVLAKHLREKIKQEPEVSAQILNSWIREEES